MNTEQELLEKIWESKGKISVQLIAKRLRISIDYVGYLCKELIRKGLIKKFERDRYKVTAKGRKSSAKIELIISTKKLSLRQRVAYKRRARKKARKKRKSGKKKILESKIQPAPLSLKDEKISSAEEGKLITPSKKKKEPNKLLKIFKGLFGAKKK